MRVLAWWLASSLAACGGAIGNPGGEPEGHGDYDPPGPGSFDASPGPVPPPAQLGGFQLGAPVPYASDGGVGGDAGVDTPGCATILGIVRDFMAYDPQGGMGHPDFEHFVGGMERTGIVQAMLDTTYRKPIYDSMSAAKSPVVTTSKDRFDQWYHNVENVNKPYYIYFYLVPGQGKYIFRATPFFPLDWRGWGNQINPHNYHFTTEVHTEFVYTGGELFSFSGDDDLWVFVNDKLAIDLGGPHPRLDKSIKLDDIAASFGLVVGHQYPLDLFHAERHTDQSNFTIETNIQFVRCNVLVPDPPK